jgi:Winged helix-turn helix
MRRCQIVRASSRGPHARLIADVLGCDDQTVRTARHAFNGHGRAALRPGSSAPPHTPHAVFDPGHLTRRRGAEGTTRGPQPRASPRRWPAMGCCCGPPPRRRNTSGRCWRRGNRAVVEPAHWLSVQEVAARSCAHDGWAHEAHRVIPEKAA